MFDQEKNVLSKWRHSVTDDDDDIKGKQISLLLPFLHKLILVLFGCKSRNTDFLIIKFTGYFEDYSKLFAVLTLLLVGIYSKDRICCPVLLPIFRKITTVICHVKIA